MTRTRRWIIVLAVVAALLVAARLALPFIVEDYANRRLGSLEAYEGHVGDIDIHLWRGAYSIDDIVIVKKNAARSVPFFRSRRTDLSIEWPSLLHGSMVATARFDQPQLNLVQAEDKQKSQLGDEEDWHAQLQKLFPFRFNTIQVAHGTVKFLAPGIQARDAITARHVRGRVSNLTNVVESGEETFADFHIDAVVLDGAPVVVAGSVDPFARQPTFDINLEVKKVKLPQVNPWLRQYIKADAEAGDFELYLELAAADGRFKGYAKPILENVDLYRSNEEEQSALRRMWEGFLDFAADVLENHEADQVAARIPFTGTIENPQTSVLATIASVMRNAFVSAFARSLEGSITLRDVKENLGELDPNEDATDDDEPDKDKGEAETRDAARKPRPGPPGKT